MAWWQNIAGYITATHACRSQSHQHIIIFVDLEDRRGVLAVTTWQLLFAILPPTRITLDGTEKQQYQN